MIKIFDNILIYDDKKIILPSSIDVIIEYDDIFIVSYCPHKDFEQHKNLIGICGIEQKSGIIKWSSPIYPYPTHIKKVIFNNKEVLNIRIDDVIYIIDIQNGKIIFKTPTKG